MRQRQRTRLPALPRRPDAEDHEVFWCSVDSEAGARIPPEHEYVRDFHAMRDDYLMATSISAGLPPEAGPPPARAPFLRTSFSQAPRRATRPAGPVRRLSHTRTARIAPRECIMGVRDGFVGTIGNTPLIRLASLSAETGCDILGKAEFLNPRFGQGPRRALHPRRRRAPRHARPRRHRGGLHGRQYRIGTAHLCAARAATASW